VAKFRADIRRGVTLAASGCVSCRVDAPYARILSRVVITPDCASLGQATTGRLVQVDDNGELRPTTSPPSTPLAHGPKPPPPPIQWETEVSTRGREPASLGGAALDVVRRVIHGDNSDG
jgi:hypothetical protein